MFHQIRWDANKLFPLHSYLNSARLKLFERSNIQKWTPQHEFGGFVFLRGAGGLGTELNGHLANRSRASIHITSAEVWSLLVDRFSTHVINFHTLFGYANSKKKNAIFVQEIGDGPSLYNSIWNKMLQNKNRKIIK